MLQLDYVQITTDRLPKIEFTSGWPGLENVETYLLGSFCDLRLMGNRFPAGSESSCRSTNWRADSSTLRMMC